MVPQSIYDGIAAFSAAVQTASPLESAPRLTITALTQQGTTLLAAIDAALTSAAGNLDAGDPAIFAGSMAAYLEALSTSADDQASLVSMRGYAGRAVFNVSQAVT